ncbi:DUF1684 domain-containing protein [Solimicrobium silvestre]|uniref:DUF1684 domain-containing protein n=1 Tax=Solimicrobium silvestre TaxID=2099400 RepID=A0A2S9H2S4_9BURK|nr:DUF1684 domain-containing protein [Solimicrobium silvestre]PRC94257.1 hypothetical protein S2091_0878 [Solimicrobium silvestre]
MKIIPSSLISALVIGLTLCASTCAAPGDNYITSLDAWRKQADEKIRSEDGPLSAIGLYWLHDGINKVGAYPSNEVVLPSSLAPTKAGIIKVDGPTVTFDTVDNVVVAVDGQDTKHVTLQKDGKIDQNNFKLGRLKFSFVNRELGLAIRVTDPNNAARRDFPGQQWFPADESWVLEGHFVPFDAPKTLVYEAATGGTRTGISPGYVSFNHDGHEYRLEVQKTSETSYLAFFFDASTGKATYAGGRVVPIEKLTGDLVKLDFNKAFNMPCAVSAFFNCQIAPQQNHLTALEIPAGEKKPLVRVQRVASAPDYIK